MASLVSGALNMMKPNGMSSRSALSLSPANVCTVAPNPPLPLLSTNYVDILMATVNGTLADMEIEFAPKATVCKYIVPKGYGVKSLVGVPLGVDEEVVGRSGAVLFYASVDEREGKLYTTSSRSLALVGCGHTIADAEERAEMALASVSGEFDARHDIGKPGTIERKIDHMREVLSGRQTD